MPLKRLAIACAFLLLRGRLAAQAPEKTARMNVVVNGGSGGPAHALGTADVRILDNGKPRRVLSVLATPGEDACGWADKATPASSVTYTNCFAPKPGTGGVLIAVVVDWTNIPPDQRVWVRRGVVGMLGNLNPQDRVGVYSLYAGRLRVLHDCTQDASVLLSRAAEIPRSRKDVLKPVKLGPDPGSRGSPPRGGYSVSSQSPVLGGGSGSIALRREISPQNEVRLFEDALAGNSAVEGALGIASGTIDSSRALVQLAEHLAGYAGRKNVIWIAAEFPMGRVLKRAIDSQEFPPPRGTLGLDEYRLLRALSGGDLSLYPVDVTPRAEASPLEDFSSDPLDGPHVPPQRTQGVARARSATVKPLAQFTGGRAYYNTRDFRRALRDAASDARRSYTVVYEAGDLIRDGRLHQIRVESSHSRLRILHPKGFFDLPTHPRAEQAREADLSELLGNPMDVGELKFLAQFRPGVSGGWEARIRLMPSGEFSPSNIEATFVERTAPGHVRMCQHSALPESEASGATFARHVRCPAGATSVLVVVRDTESGAFGSVRVPLTGKDTH